MGKLKYSGKLLKQFWKFARAHKAYWIIPMILLLGLIALLIISSQAASPFIYTLF
jgi:hypothetical protein